MLRSSSLFFASLFVVAALGSAQADNAATNLDAGPLDRPLSIEGEPVVITSLSPSSESIENPIHSQEELREAVVEEQETLEKLPRNELENKANQGERAAQVVLGADFAREATLLSFAPAAANDALSDAVRWYALAASRGFPGAPSLDQAGVRFYPIRVQRDPAP